MLKNSLEIAVLLPCYNEEVTIANMVRKCKEILPQASIYVGNNNSSDNTQKLAEKAGAIVINECRQGKGHMMRRLFTEIDADVYVVLDADETYHLESAPKMIELMISNRLDMVNGKRVSQNNEAFRKGHAWGNLLFSGLTNFFFGDQIKDTLSGFRVMSRRLVKSYPLLATRFEHETRITIHALGMNMPVAEVDTPYIDRPTGSHSTVSTYKDGWRMLMTIVKLVIFEKPLLFYGTLIFKLGLLALIVLLFKKSSVLTDYANQIFAILMILSLVAGVVGIISHLIASQKMELRKLFYLSIPGISEDSQIIT